MREIEFRGKVDDKTRRLPFQGEFVYGDLAHDRPGNPMITVREGGKAWDCFMVDPETVGQYTGLKDRNGVKIFEGDIVCYKTMNFPVRWDDERSGFFIGEDKYWMMNDCDLEVIGNWKK